MNPLLDTIPRCHGLKFPRFVTGWMITDLVMISLQLLMIPAIFIVHSSSLPADFSAIFDYWCWNLLVSSCGIVASGYPAAVGLLCKHRWALVFGKIEIAFNLLSLFIMLFLLLEYICPVFTMQECFRKPYFYIWLFFVLLWGGRITWLVFYWKALVRAKKFFRKRGF